MAGTMRNHKYNGAVDRISADASAVYDVNCNGQGAVPRTALKHGKQFICSDLNINRLAVAIEDLMNVGAKIEARPKQF